MTLIHLIQQRETRINNDVDIAISFADILRLIVMKQLSHLTSETWSNLVRSYY